DLQHAIRRHTGTMGPAGPPRDAVDAHRARCAQPDATRETVRERRIDPALDVADDVEHSLARAARDVVRGERPACRTAPDTHLQRFGHRAILVALYQGRAGTGRRRWEAMFVGLGSPLLAGRRHNKS